jgi:hypothetical protein
VAPRIDIGKTIELAKLAVVRGRTSRIEMREVPFGAYDSISAARLRPVLTVQKAFASYSRSAENCLR